MDEKDKMLIKLSDWLENWLMPKLTGSNDRYILGQRIKHARKLADAQSEQRTGWKCPECGKQNGDNEFCQNCGYFISSRR